MVEKYREYCESVYRRTLAYKGKTKETVHNVIYQLLGAGFFIIDQCSEEGFASKSIVAIYEEYEEKLEKVLDTL